jgi:hypothetical protein
VFKKDTKRNNQSIAETRTSFDMSRKSKYQTKALNIPFTLTQGDLLQEALAVTFAKVQTQPEMATSDWSDFLAADWLTMEHISILLPPDYILEKQKLTSLDGKSKSKDQTRALNIPFTLTQGDLLQEALAVTFAKDQTQALNIPVKVPLGGGIYAELTEWNGSKRVDLRFWNLNLK